MSYTERRAVTPLPDVTTSTEAVPLDHDSPATLIRPKTLLDRLQQLSSLTPGSVRLPVTGYEHHLTPQQLPTSLSRVAGCVPMPRDWQGPGGHRRQSSALRASEVRAVECKPAGSCCTMTAHPPRTADSTNHRPRRRDSH